MTTRSDEGQRSDRAAQHASPPVVRGVGSLVGDLAPLVPAVVVLGVLLQVATGHGAGHRELAMGVLAVLVTQVLPGAVLWRAVRREHGWWVEDLVLGLAVGAALAVPTQLLVVATSSPLLHWLVPALVVGSLLMTPRTRQRVLAARTAPLPWTWGVLVAASTLLPAYQVLAVYRQPVRWSGWAVPYVDVPYHLALAGELAHRWPLHYPQLASEPLSYHWFSYAWIAQVSATSGAPLDVVLLRFMPALLAVAVPLAAAVVAARLSGRLWAGPVAAISTFLVGELDVWGTALPGYNLSPLSPTLGFSTLVLLPLLALMVSRWRGEARSGALLLVVVLAVVAGGSKGSVLPVLLVGLALASAAALVTGDRSRRRVWGDTAVLALLLLVLLRTVFGSGDRGMQVRPFSQLVKHRALDLVGGAEVGTTAVVGLVVVVYLSIFLGSAPALAALLPGSRTSRDPAVWLLLGAGAAGAGAIAVFAQPGLSQWYFLMTAQVPLGLLVGWGFALLLERSAHPARTVAVGAAAGVLAAVAVQEGFGGLPAGASPVWDVWLPLVSFLAAVGVAAWVVGGLSSGRGARRWTAATAASAALVAAGLVPTYDVLSTPLETASTDAGDPGAMHARDAAAARWLRDHSAPDDLVSTNRHCADRRESDRCDHRIFQVAAYTERGVLVEGWAYAKPAYVLATALDRSPSRVPFWDEDLLELNDGFIERPTAAGARELHGLGVRWVVVSDHAPHADTLEPFASRRVRGRSLTVYELTPPGEIR